MPQPGKKKKVGELEALIAQARRNESIALKLFDIELEMLKAATLSGFIDQLMAQVRDRFQLNDVWNACHPGSTDWSS